MKKYLNLPSILLILTIVFIYATKSKDISLADSFIILGLSCLYGLKSWFDFKTPPSIEKTPEMLEKENEMRKLYTERELVKARLDIKRLTKSENDEERTNKGLIGF